MTEKLKYNPCKVRKHCKHYKKGIHRCDYVPIAFFCGIVSLLTFYVNRIDIISYEAEILEKKERYGGLTLTEGEKLTKYLDEIRTLKERIENISI